MKEVRVLEIKESVFADNDRQADNLRRELKEQGVFLMNLMSSPGSGKTTTLKGTIEQLKDRFSKQELNSLIEKIRQVESVLDVERTTG